MRAILMSAVILLASAVSAQAQLKSTAPPTDEAIIAMCGARLPKVFSQFGAPVDVGAVRGKDEDDDRVYLNYDSYDFLIKDRVVIICYFLSSWKGTVRGVKIGDTREAVQAALGQPDETTKNKDGADDLGYRLKDNDAEIWVILNKEGKVRRMQVELDE